MDGAHELTEAPGAVMHGSGAPGLRNADREVGEAAGVLMLA